MTDARACVVNRSKYAAAQELIRSGVWLADFGEGIIYSPARRRVLGNVGSGGYVRTSIKTADGKRCSLFVHRVLWEAKYGLIPDGLQVNHIDGDKQNNRLLNLEIVTPSQNKRHAHEMGLCGSDIVRTPLEKAICAAMDQGMSQASIAAAFGVGGGTVARVRARRPGHMRQNRDPNRTHKFCAACHLYKSVDSFYPRKGRIDGRDSYCKPCKNRMTRALETVKFPKRDRPAKALSADQVAELMRLHREGWTGGQLSAHFNLGRSTPYSIIRRMTLKQESSGRVL